MDKKIKKITFFCHSCFIRCVCFIEVNPRHAKFYERFYLFEQIGDEKECDRVEGAPAVLMRMDLDFQEEVICEAAGRESTGEFSRTLYSRYMPYSAEETVAERLRLMHRPMDLGEAVYFGLAEAFRENRRFGY